MNSAVKLPKKERKQKDFTTGPIFTKMIAFTVPLILSGLLQLLYNAADLVVAGRFAGEIALAAVGATGSFNNLLVNVFMGLTVGAGVVASHYIGAGQSDRVSRVTHTAFVCSAVGGVFVGVLCFFICRPVLALMGTPDNVIELSTLYMKIIAVGMPASLTYNMCASILRADGETLRPMIFLSISGMVNFCLNLVLVIVFHFGVAGVAIATVVSQYASAVMILIYMRLRPGCTKFSFRKIKVCKNELTRIISIGLPAGLQSALFSISNMLIQSSVNSFGDLAMSGNAAASNLEGFTYTAMNSFHHAALNFTGQNFGAHNKKRVKRSLWCAVATVSIVGIAFSALLWLFRYPLLGLYITDSAEAITFGVRRMSVCCLIYFSCGIMDAVNGGLRGIGAATPAMIITLFGTCVFRVAWIATVFRYILQTPEGIFISYPISWIVTGGVQLLLFIILVNRKFKAFDRSTRLEIAAKVD